MNWITRLSRQQRALIGACRGHQNNTATGGRSAILTTSRHQHGAWHFIHFTHAHTPAFASCAHAPSIFTPFRSLHAAHALLPATCTRPHSARTAFATHLPRTTSSHAASHLFSLHGSHLRHSRTAQVPLRPSCARLALHAVNAGRRGEGRRHAREEEE